MAKKAYAVNLEQSQTMIDGLKGRVDNLPLGITAEVISQLETLRKQMENINSEQEKLKADLKMKTEEFYKVSADLEEKISFAKKRIKLDVPQAQWREFGINDKK